jgi:hypothetical protein
MDTGSRVTTTTKKSSQRWYLFVIFVTFRENGSSVFPWLSERILFTEERKGREDKPGRLLF